MNESEIIYLAMDCGAQVKPHPWDAEITLVTFTLFELKEFIEMIQTQLITYKVEGGGG